MSAKSMQIGQNWSQKNLFRAGSYRLAFSRKKNYAVKTGGNGFFTRIPTSKPCSKIRPKFAKVDAENFILRAKNSPLGTDFAFKKWVLRTLLTGWPWLGIPWRPSKSLLGNFGFCLIQNAFWAVKEIQRKF